MARNALICLSFVWNVSIFQSQEVIGAGGDFFTSSSGSLSWTTGEVITETISANSAVFTQGFQQNYEKFVSLEQLLYSNNIFVFPNPFNSELNVQWNSLDYLGLSIQLSDNYGKIFSEIHFNKNDIQNQATVDVSELAAGAYYLTISHPTIFRPTIFKVVKF